MGICSSQHKYTRKKGGKIELKCPICEEDYDIELRKPFNVCKNEHRLCLKCLTLLKTNAEIKQLPEVLCPFCRSQIEQSLVSIDRDLYAFLKSQLKILNKLPQNKKNLYAFSFIYMPILHNLMKEQAQAQGLCKNQLESIKKIKVKQKMPKEYQIFQLGIFDCIDGIKNIYLVDCQIKDIEVKGFNRNRVQLLDISSNLITTIKNIVMQANNSFAFLKVLKLRNNLIEDIQSLKHFEYLQILNCKANRLKSIKFCDGCNQLRHLNIQFNQINQIDSFYSNLSSLQCFQLYGNQLSTKSWALFLKEQWKMLKYLSASINTRQIHQKYQIHDQIVKSIKSSSFHLFVFQMSQTQPQYMGGSVPKAKRQIGADKIIKFELHAENYQFYVDNKSFLSDLIIKAMTQHPLGKNINFCAVEVGKSYQIVNPNIYKKISEDYNEYLYSVPIKKGKYFTSFKTNTSNLSFGIFENTKNRRIELNLDNRKILINNQYHQIKIKENDVKSSGNEITMSFGKQDNILNVYINEVDLQGYILIESWQQYRFFISLKKVGDQVRIIRNQLFII